MSGSEFIDAIGRNYHAMSGDSRDKVYLWQRLSMALQRALMRSAFAAPLATRLSGLQKRNVKIY
jgi:hypothetical protein